MKRPCVICDNAYNTRHICDDCRAGVLIGDKRVPVDSGWLNPSDEEWPTAEIEIVKTTMKLEALQGGKRKEDTEKVRRVVEANRTMIVRVRRRRNVDGKPLRGWENRLEPKTYRELAKESECSESYVRKVLARIRK